MRKYFKQTLKEDELKASLSGDWEFIKDNVWEKAGRLDLKFLSMMQTETPILV
jgi:hypothetical protein